MTINQNNEDNNNASTTILNSHCCGDSQIIVVIPTYDERENVKPMAEAVLETTKNVRILFVDDNSPDGTGEVIDEMASKDERIVCLHRQKKEGLGRAYISGFLKALEMGAERVIQMDCDFSHKPADINRLIAEDADLVIGSRYVKGGSTPGWPFKRRFISRAGGLFIRLMTGIKVKDVTGGFKCWRRGLLEKLDLKNVASAGYSFQLEMNNRAWRKGATIKEIPIAFSDRQRGYSKISGAIAIESIKMAFALSRFKNYKKEG